MVSFPNDNNLTHNAHRTHCPGNYSRSYVDASRDKAGPFSTFCPSKRNFGKCSTPSLATPSRSTMHLVSSEVETRPDNETVTLLYRLANHMEQPWRSKARARLKLVLKFRNASVPRFNKPLKLPFLAHSQFKTNVQNFLANLIRQHRHVLVPYHLPTKTVQEMPHQALSKALWNHKRTITDLGRDWKVQTCQCQEFAKSIPEYNYSKAMSPSTCRSLRTQRILDEFEQFFDKERQLHRQQVEQDPRLTHRLVKHIIHYSEELHHPQRRSRERPSYDLSSQLLQSGGVQHLDGFQDLPHARQKRPGH